MGIKYTFTREFLKALAITLGVWFLIYGMFWTGTMITEEYRRTLESRPSAPNPVLNQPVAGVLALHQGSAPFSLPRCKEGEVYRWESNEKAVCAPAQVLWEDAPVTPSVSPIWADHNFQNYHLDLDNSTKHVELLPDGEVKLTGFKSDHEAAKGMMKGIVEILKDAQRVRDVEKREWEEQTNRGNAALEACRQEFAAAGLTASGTWPCVRESPDGKKFSLVPCKPAENKAGGGSK